MSLRTYSLPQITPVGAEFPDDDKNSRPPDAAIRATTDIMREGMAFFGRAMEACVATSGLNFVLGGSNPGVARPPQKISGLNSEDLAALGNLSSAASKSPDESKTDDKKDDSKPEDASKSQPPIASNIGSPPSDDKSPSTTTDTTPTTTDWSDAPPAVTPDDQPPPATNGSDTPAPKEPTQDPVPNVDASEKDYSNYA